MIKDVHDIAKALTYLESDVYGVMHRNIRKDWAYIDQDPSTIKTMAPENEPPTIPPDALREHRKAVNQIYSSQYSITIKPNDTKKQKAFNDLAKEFIDYLIVQNNTRNESNIGKEFAGDLALGFGAIKGPLWMANEECPIVFHPIDALSIFPDPSGNYVIETYDRTIGEVKEEIRKTNEEKKGKREGKKSEYALYSDNWFPEFIDDYGKLKWIAYYSNEDRCFVVASIDTDKVYGVSDFQKNILGYIPFIYSYSGWGRGKSSGIPEGRAVSRLKGMHSSIDARARHRTAADVHLRYTVFGQRVAPLEAQEFFKPDYFAKKPGDIMFVPDMYIDRIKVLPNAPMPPDLYASIAMNDKDIEGVGGNAALQGMGPTDESGLKAMTRVRQSAEDFEAPRENFNGGFSKLFTNVFKLIKNDILVTKPIPLWGKVSISASNVPANIRVFYTLEEIDPIADRAMMEVGMRLVERGLLTKQMFATLYGKYPNAATFLEEWMAEQVLTQVPQLMLGLAQEALREAGMNEAADFIGSGIQENVGKIAQGSGNKQTIPENIEQRMKSGNPQDGVDTRQLPGVGGRAGGMG